MTDDVPLFRIRPAQAVDEPAIERLHRASVRRLAVSYYPPAQVEIFLACATLDRGLIEAGTYYVAELGDALVGSGGWMPVEQGPGGAWRARIRAVFVHPDWARRGIGRRLVTHAETAAARAGFTSFELDATLGGVPLYQSLGYREVARCGYLTPNGATLPVVRMEKAAPSVLASCA
ncbi:MAG TPA: GNAT family N-acetyltransferase [Alphaproteobacteria bacterium]|nr:GNAT family N-acetyltransferase [Alphaproteobacteria bacterium]